MSARNITEPLCDVELAEGMRPEPPPEPEPTPEPPKSEVTETAPEAAETTEAASAVTEQPKTTEETQPAYVFIVVDILFGYLSCNLTPSLMKVKVGIEKLLIFTKMSQIQDLY